MAWLQTDGFKENNFPYKGKGSIGHRKNSSQILQIPRSYHLADPIHVRKTARPNYISHWLWKARRRNVTRCCRSFPNIQRDVVKLPIKFRTQNNFFVKRTIRPVTYPNKNNSSLIDCCIDLSVVVGLKRHLVFLAEITLIALCWNLVLWLLHLKRVYVIELMGQSNL